MTRILILLSIVSICFISLQKTIFTVIEKDAIVEMMESSEKETEKENEKEAEKEYEFVLDYLAYLRNSELIENASRQAFHKNNKYKSPVRSVLTPPPNKLV